MLKFAQAGREKEKWGEKRSLQSVNEHKSPILTRWHAAMSKLSKVK